MSICHFTNSQKCHFLTKLFNPILVFLLWLFLLPRSSWFPLFKRINWRKEKQKGGGRRQRQKYTMFKMPVSFVSVSSVIPGNTRQVCKSLRGRRKGKKTFYHSPQVVVHPTFSYREVVHLKEHPWQYSGCSFTATSLQSQLCSRKGLPLLSLPFFPCHCFCKAGC